MANIRKGGGSHSAGSHSKSSSSKQVRRDAYDEYSDYSAEGITDYPDSEYDDYSEQASYSRTSVRSKDRTASRSTRSAEAEYEYADNKRANKAADISTNGKKSQLKLFKLLVPVILVAIVAIAVIKIVGMVGSKTVEEPVTKELETTPEPVDLREYKLDLPQSGIEVVDYTISCLADDLKTKFNAKHDGSEPAVLETSYILGSAENGMFNFLLTVSDAGELERKTYTISNEGGLLTPAEALGEKYAEYVSDYLNITGYTDKASINKDGVILLYNDIVNAVTVPEEGFPLYLLSDDGGAELLIPNSSVSADAQLLPEGSFVSNELPYDERPLVMAEKTRARAEAGESLIEEPVVTAEEAPADNSQPEETSAPVEETVQTEEAAEQAEAAAESVDAVVETPAAEAAASEAEQQPETSTAPEPRISDLAEETDSIDFCIPAYVIKGEFFARRRLYPDKPMLAITYDDGPRPETSNGILDILEQYGVVATFYEIGTNVESHPEVLLRELQLGCEIGSHTYHHYKLSELSGDQMLYERNLYKDVFKRAIGFSPVTVRPPEGDAMGLTLAVFDEPLIGWSVDTEDWLNKNPKTIMYKVQSFEEMYGHSLDGQIILMHSIYETTVEATQELIPWLLEQGFQLVTVSELLEYYYCEPQPTEGYYYYQFDYLAHGVRGVPHQSKSA